ncbi:MULTISPECIES: hypothetical protein [unclassified Fibrobacter]|uniref:hypothetical protein n=1 Tax=unclassified Fibrobacter TaxID=2634177 RepID=UPI000932BDA5|nr:MULTISPECIES: hypothetical protein [unclassified Fibrobacter]
MAKLFKGMTKRFLLCAVISLFFAVHANAWDMGTYVENAQAGEGIIDTNTIWKKDQKQKIIVDTSMAKANGSNQNKKSQIKHHSIGFEYDFLTLFDFGAGLSHLFDDKCEKLFSCSYGAVSIDYGYAFDYIETGIILNLFIYDPPITTVMAKLKINGNLGGFVNPFFELDAGISIMSDRVIPMGHISLLGFEIGYPVSVRFQVPFLLWGAKGITNIGIGYRF